MKTISVIPQKKDNRQYLSEVIVARLAETSKPTEKQINMLFEHSQRTELSFLASNPNVATDIRARAKDESEKLRADLQQNL